MKTRVYIGAGVTLLFFAVLLVVNGIFFPGGSVGNIVTRRNEAKGEFADMYDASNLAAKPHGAAAYFYAPIYADGGFDRETYPAPTDNVTRSAQTGTTPLSAAETAKAALGGYAAKYPLYSVVRNDGGGFTVTFSAELDGLRDLAFTAVVELSAAGYPLWSERAEYKYERLSAAALATEKEAERGLPDPGGNVALSSCELVYAYIDSIVQPAYLFTGEYADGGRFECFVRAAKFNN